MPKKWPSRQLEYIHYFCNLSNLDGRVYVWLGLGLGLVLGLVLGLGFGLGLVLGFGLGLGFAMICSGHGHLCLTGCGNSAPSEYAIQFSFAETFVVLG